MALLNYSSSFLQQGTLGQPGYASGISTYVNATVGSTDWLKIFISPDTAGGGHFITHGIDFGASYVGGQRGLVPGNSGTLDKTFLRGDGWSALWTAAAEAASAVGDTLVLQLAAKEAYLQSTIVSAYDIKEWIKQSYAANNAMRFKGKITIDNSGNISTVTDEGTTAGFPTSCEVGDTYKITGTSLDNNSTIANEYVNTGDMAVCIKAGTGANLNSGEYWTIIQDNVEHLVNFTINGTVYRVYAQTSSNFAVYAPTTYGTNGYLVIAKGEGVAPEWVNPSTVKVGEASKVTYALTAGAGIAMTHLTVAATSYDGTDPITIKLSPATDTSIGGVIIDGGDNSEKYNAAINTSNTLYPTISVNNDGEIYLSKTNIINALGYDPISALPIFTDSADGLVPMSSLANKQTNNVDNVAAVTTYVLGDDAKWYKLPASAFQSDRRIINLNGTTIINAASGNALNIITGNHINITPTLDQNTNDYTGAVTFEAVWRDIQVRLVNGTTIGQTVSSIGDDDPLVFDNSDSVFMLGEQFTVGSGANATQKTVIKSYITWYNMDTGEYEII